MVGIALIVVVVIVAVVVVAVAGARRAADRGRATAEAEVGPDERIVRQATVNSFGEASRGMGQVRGNGTLVLTDETLVFSLWVPARSWRVARSDLLGVDVVRSHLGKTRGVPLLRVRWQHGAGDEDSVAFQVDDLEGWRRDLGVGDPAS